MFCRNDSRVVLVALVKNWASGDLRVSTRIWRWSVFMLKRIIALIELIKYGARHSANIMTEMNQQNQLVWWRIKKNKTKKKPSSNLSHVSQNVIWIILISAVTLPRYRLTFAWNSSFCPRGGWASSESLRRSSLIVPLQRTGPTHRPGLLAPPSSCAWPAFCRPPLLSN